MYADYDKSIIDRIVAYAKPWSSWHSAIRTMMSADPLCVGAEHPASPADKTTPASSGRSHPGGDRRLQPHIRRGALSDPSLRLSPDRRRKARCRAALRQDRAGGAHAQHMPSHISHASAMERTIASNAERRVSRRNPGFPRPAARDGLSGRCHLQLGQDQKASHHRRGDDRRGFTETSPAGPYRGYFAGALRRGTGDWKAASDFRFAPARCLR